MRGYRGGNVAGLTLRPPSNRGHQTEAPDAGLFFCLVLGGIAEIVLHPPLHRTENKKPRYLLDSRVSLLYLGWLMGLEPTTTGITILDSTN